MAKTKNKTKQSGISTSRGRTCALNRFENASHHPREIGRASTSAV